jgi:signal transduction histidine kinase
VVDGSAEDHGLLDLDLGDPFDGPRFLHELHDAVREDLTDLLIELELARRSRPSPEVDRHVRTVRDVVVALRRLLFELHGGEAESIGALTRLERGTGIAVTRQRGTRTTDD